MDTAKAGTRRRVVPGLAVLGLLAGLLATIGVTSPAVAEPAGSEVRRVAAASMDTGGYFSCALTTSGGVRCWGDGAVGKTGHGDTEDIGDDEPASAGSEVSVGGPATAISVGRDHACALLATGAVRCWGNNGIGQLGQGNTTVIGDNEVPSSVPPVSLGGPAMAVSAGREHTCALMATGAVRCWGYGANGRLGLGNTTSIGDDEAPSSVAPVALGGAAVAVSAGDHHTCALLATGAVRCWGSGVWGALGQADVADIGDNEVPASVSPVSIGGAAVAISAGSSTTCALLATGDVRCWGYGGAGATGVGNSNHIGDTEVPSSEPPVALGGKAVAIDVTSHACAVLTTGAVRCWGHNGQGQLGYGHDTTDATTTPAAAGNVSLAGTAAAVSTASEHTCATLTSGAIRCWGYGGDGALGQGNETAIGDTELPTAVGPVPLGAKVRVLGQSKLKAKVKPRKDKRAPYKFKVKGKLDGLFVKDAATCGGTVKVKVKAKGRNHKGKKKTKKVLKKKTRILDTCKVKKKKLKIKPKKLRKKGFDLDQKKIKLKVIMKYKGTDNLERAKKKRNAKIRLN